MEFELGMVNMCKSCAINGHEIPNLTDYKITSSADGTTKLVLTLKFNAEFVSTNLKV